MLWLVMAMAVGCAGTQRYLEEPTLFLQASEGHCRPTGSAFSFSEMEDTSIRLDAVGEPPALSREAKEIAEHLGLIPLLSAVAFYEAEQARGVPESEYHLLTLQAELSDRLLLGVFDVSSVIAELECERARAEELAVRLEEIQNDIRQLRMTGAIVAEPVFHIAAASALALGMPAVAGGLEILGNGLRNAFGWASLGGVQQHELRHSRNLLGEIWQGGDRPEGLPASIWRFLSRPLAADESATRRGAILAEWRRKLGVSGPEGVDRRVELLFGPGGRYGVEDLRRRADMLRVLRAHVNLMSQ